MVLVRFPSVLGFGCFGFVLGALGVCPSLHTGGNQVASQEEFLAYVADIADCPLSIGSLRGSLCFSIAPSRENFALPDKKEKKRK